MRKAWLRLDSAFRSGTGHVLVTAATRQEAVDMVDAALERSAALAVLRVRAASTDPLAVIDETREVEPGSQLGHADRREVLRGLLENARALDAKVFTVVEDADDATAEELERVRMSVECLPEAIERLRVVLVGTPRLDLTLSDPAASALASRVSTHVRLGAPSSPAKTAALNTLSSVRLAAAGMMTVAVAALFGRSHTVDSSQPKVTPERTAARDAMPSDAGTNSSAVATDAARPKDDGAAEAADAVAVSEETSDVVATVDAAVPASADAAVEPQPSAPSAALNDAATTGAVDVEAGRPAEQEAGLNAEVTHPHTAETAPAQAASDAQAATAIAKVTERVKGAAESARAEASSEPAAAASEGTDAERATSVEPATAREQAAAAKRRVVSAARPSARLPQPVVMEVAAFKEAAVAQALQEQLATKVAKVLVARLDASRGVVYSVRVVGLETARAVAHAEREIRSLGYRPVRIAAGSARARAGTIVHETAKQQEPEKPQPTRRSGVFGSRYRGR